MTDAAPRRHPAPPTGQLLHGGITVAQYHSMHFLGALFPLTAGLMLYGWRAGLAVLTVLGAALLALAAWRHVGGRGRQLDRSHTLWLALLLAMMLPAHLAGGRDAGPRGGALWPILSVAGAGLVILLWLLGGLGAGPIHPVPLAFLLLTALFHEQMVPQRVLQRGRMVAGDVLHAPLPQARYDGPDAWLHRPPTSGHDAFRAEPAARRLAAYTAGVLHPERGQMPLHELLRDRMPPLEDLIVGGEPGPLGAASVVGVVIGGLFLLYRGLIDFRIPLLTVACAFATLLVLPIPTVIRQDGAHFRWLALREPDVRWETAFTFVHYELMAGPLLFVAFFLATAPSVRPLSRRARALYACLLGVLCGAAQLYVSVAWGPYAALLAAGAAAPVLDRWFKPRALV